MPYKDKAKRNEYMQRRRASLKLENQMWTGIRVWYPPFAAVGAYYRTQFVSNKVEVKDGKLFGVVTIMLTPEAKGE